MVSRRDAFNGVIRNDLASFIWMSFNIISPADSFLPNWHIEVIADHLMRCYRGEIKRLIITMPPRSLKSICTSIAFPAWVLGHDPSCRLICASYSADLSEKFARDFRCVMSDEAYLHAFPNTRLDRMATQDLQTTQQGGRLSTSIGGTLTGRGADIIIIDDPMKPLDGTSASQREAVKQWYDGTLFSRLNNKSEGTIILVMQRLHVDDLVAHLIEKGDWLHLNLPAIAETDQTFELSDGRIIERTKGEILHPNREPMETLMEIKATMGSFHFSAQYQQQPIPEKGNIIQWPWFKTYESPPPYETDDIIVQSWDTASKDTEMADYSVCTTWHIKGKDYYLIDVFRKKLNFPELIKAVQHQGNIYRSNTILIEEAGSGIGLIDYLKKDRTSNIPYPIGIKPQGDKATRISVQTAKIEAGHVFLPEKADWLGDFQTELMAFPEAKHDDQVDSVSQFLGWVGERGRNEIRMVKLEGF